jgi:hypothetical protein
MKFKFINKQFLEFTDLENYPLVENPLPYKNLPDGEYLIRGTVKAQRKVYWKFGTKWYLIEDVLKDNGHYYCDSTQYMLFPILSEKEWVNIRKVGWKKLNKVWQRHLFGYLHWKELCHLRRDTKLAMFRFDKIYDENIENNL